MDWEQVANQQQVPPPVRLTIHQVVYERKPVRTPVAQRDKTNGETHDKDMQRLDPVTEGEKTIRMFCFHDEFSGTAT